VDHNAEALQIETLWEGNVDTWEVIDPLEVEHQEYQLILLVLTPNARDDARI
jgi:hypothetical protein